VLNLMDPIELEGLVICRDDEDCRKFYPLPDQPVIPLDDEGTPELLFIKYLRDVEEVGEGEEVGGGYVQFRSVLTIAPERRQRVIEALRALLEEEKAAGKRPCGQPITSTEPLLADPLWTGGTVTMSTFQVSDTGLVRYATESAPVDLAGDLGASLRAELDTDGAEIFWGAFRDQRSTQIPILITYQLTYKARISASLEIHASREVIHRRIWQQARPYRLLRMPFVRYVPIAWHGPFMANQLVALRAQFAEPVAAMVEGPQIRETISQTITDNEITVRIDTDEAGGGAQAAEVQEMLFKVATDVLTERVVPSVLGDGSTLPGAGSEAAGQADTSLVQLGESGPGGDMRFDLELTQRSAIERAVNPNGPIHLLVGDPAALERCFRELRLADGFFDTMRVTASTAGVNFERDGIEKLHVFLRYAQRDEANPLRPMINRSTDGVLHSAAEAVHWRFDTARSSSGGHKEEYEYRTDVFYLQGGPPSSTDWTRSTARMLLITPQAMGALRVEAVLTAPREVVDSARVALRHTAGSGDRFETALELEHERNARTWFQFTGELETGGDVGAPGYEYQVSYRVGGSEVVTPWTASTAQTLEIPSPFRKVLTFVVRPQGSFEGVSNLSGDIVYEDQAHQYRVVQSFQLVELASFHTFQVPIFAGAPEEARWTARLNRADGSSLTLAPGKGPPGTVWVGTEVDFLSVEVRPDLLDFENDVELALVKLVYVDPANALNETSTFTFTKTARDPRTWRVARKDRALDRYDVDIRYVAYDRSKSSEVSLRQVNDQVLLLDRDAAPGP
jgi:hypothetical protein